jgi:NDP-sugar pyrophosphorylase family protein/aminoglycoside/choline kinase family phosphotransferase
MSKFPINIFLPAAGLGERLRPITNHLPKPLLPVLGKPIIEGILEKLTLVCSGKIGVNLHYKSEMVRAWVGKSPYAKQVTFFPEDPILGTGGALKNAETFLSTGHFIMHNSDILLNIDFSRLIEEHLSSGNVATLACHRIPDLSNVVIDGNGQVLDVENPGASKPDPQTTAEKIAYTGIAVYSPEILKFLPTGVSHATVAWIAASKAGHKVRAMDFTGSSWSDVGNPVTYARAVLDALRDDGETVHISKSARCGNIGIDGYVVMESGSEVKDGSSIRNCIVMPGARVSGKRENSILGPDYVVSLTESDMQPSLHAAQKKRVSLNDPLFASYFGIQTTDESNSAQPLHSAIRQDHPLPYSLSLPRERGGGEGHYRPHSASWSDAILIGLGGSDRRYFRVRNDGKTAVLMECGPDDTDYERHLVYTIFFASHTMPVPGLLATDDAHKRALFEDLGDTSLYSYMKLPHGNSHIEDVYRKVLDILVKLHTRASEHVHECPMLQERIFGYEYLRWETNYFLERFVNGLARAPLNEGKALDEEFHRLATKADALPKSVIHRDFQCQNIMITGNGVPRVIDYQGARMAPPAYDVASILWDPYHRLDDGVRENLIGYYVNEMKKNSKDFDERTFFESIIPCRLQRHMQALGAYGFLSVEKGKKYFLKHVPEALRLLNSDIAGAKKDYPELYKLVNSLQ